MTHNQHSKGQEFNVDFRICRPPRTNAPGDALEGFKTLGQFLTMKIRQQTFLYIPSTYGYSES